MLSANELELRRDWFREHWQSHIPFAQLIGLEITEWTPGLVRARLPYADRLCAHDGVFHGGVLATAIDSIATGAVISGHDFNLGSRLSTVSMTVQFMAIAPYQDIVIEGSCTKRGRNLNFARGSVLSAGGKLLAEGVLSINVGGERPRVDAPEHVDALEANGHAG